ncbi:MAG: hypothetical protein EGR44_00650, partial [Ruminococcaceae bacterium]|nr:hypothetical protein [Oscillospiraceae bacterium]
FAGINEEQSQYTLQPREVFTTPVFAFTFSDEGKSGVSRNIHSWARLHRLNHGTELRDVLLNSWEGVYFKVNQEGMDRMMADLADLGGELFVMDDGWFGDKYPRNNGETSLGDWTVCREKLPQGIEGLTESARRHGVKFGIWIEPEMTNTRSELYEKHPDWVIQQPYRENRKGRGGTQQVLDLSNPAVQEFVFGVVDHLMTAHPDIAYIKWDDNMTLYNYGSTFLPADRQSHLFIEYHRGMDKVLRRIREKYPRLVMQSCASGGGRVNYGVLPYYDEFWTSDNTDALQRIYMQWGVSNFYPAVAMASHVSASPNHQTGRSVPLKLRFDVAMSGRLGLELQPSKMTDKEKRLTAYHEAGHAVSAYYLEYNDPVHQVSIVPRGQMGGYTMYLPTEDKSYHSKNEMLDNLVSLLGGRVAEALIIGDVSTGASNDIERATDIARKMVTKYGMSEKLGPITFGSGNDEVFLGRDYSHLKNYSEETAAEIDEEINRIITTAYGRTEDILKEHIDRLHAVAGALIEREKISGEEFETIMHGGTLDPLSAQSDDSKPAEVPEQSDAQNNEEADGNEKESE